MVTFLSSKVALLIFYLIQEFVQNFYNKLSEYGENKISFKFILFLFRSLYANLLSLALVLQYRSYWDFYNGNSL